MDAAAVDANEDPVGDGRPGRVLRPAVETNLKDKIRSECGGWSAKLNYDVNSTSTPRLTMSEETID